MAIQPKGSKASNTTATTSTMKKADAYLNLSVTDANGKARPLPKGLPLFKDEKLHAAIMAAAEKYLVESGGSAKEFTLTATVWFPSEEPAEEIIF